jgi:putative tryptophan/tyrosine transport system substrate-binding protein
MLLIVAVASTRRAALERWLPSFLVTGALLLAPLAVDAQPGSKVHRIAVVFTAVPVAEMMESGNPPLRAFFTEMKLLGYVEGRNLIVERRSALGRPERVPEIAAEVVRLNPDVIVVGANRIARAFQGATSTIPIVGASLSFPVEYGLATSLARPGGNLTGLTDDAGPEIAAKALELLTEAVPGTARVAYTATTNLWNGPVGALLRDAAQRRGITLVAALMDGPFQEAQYLESFRRITRTGAQAVLVGPTGEHWVNRRLIAELATRNRLPTMAPWREFVEAGGLMAYGVSTADNWRRAAHYVDRILKGAKPGDLPIEQPTRFELVISLRTATTLGVIIPPAMLARADEVIR